MTIANETGSACASAEERGLSTRVASHPWLVRFMGACGFRLPRVGCQCSLVQGVLAGLRQCARK
jgi:hypothetical protein